MSALVLFSAGLDSAAAAFEACRLNLLVDLLYVRYGSRQQSTELAATTGYISWLRAKFPTRVINLTLMDASGMFGSSGLTDKQVKLDQKTDVEVKGRNMLFLALANSMALHCMHHEIYIGTNRGIADDVHPDASKEFVAMMARAIDQGSKGKVRLRAPFAEVEKSGVWAYVQEHGIPSDLTYSCYSGDFLPCGVCDACVVRRKTAQMAGVLDPAVYQN